jgi:fibro-slime domain-containing protein
MLAVRMAAVTVVFAVGAGCAGVKAGPGTGGGGGGSNGGAGGMAGGRGGAGGIASTTGGGGQGNRGGDIGGGQDAGDCSHDVRAVIRDFRGFTVQADQPKHPDFEYVVGDMKGLVQPTIGADQKPVYAPAGPTPVTNGPDYFNQWYRDVDGVNQNFEITIPLTEDPARPGVFLYDSDAFFPIDTMGWGNQYQSHNYDFTTEVHFNFPYRGGEAFTFRGDDDVFVFVNGHLAIDLGGVHTAQKQTIDMDLQATALAITKGGTYRMDIFHAERHTADSTFHIETTLQCIDNVIVP